MHRSVAVFLLALSCVTAFPVLFLSLEDSDDDDGEAKLLECDSPINGLTYRCRHTTRTPESFGVKLNDVPFFKIIDDEPENEISILEVEEISVPVGYPAVDSLFQSSKIIVKNNDATNANTKYDVFPESRTGKRNQGGCTDYEVFVAELDICMPYSPSYSAPKTANINNNEEPIPVVPDFTILNVGYAAKSKCPEGQINLPFFDVCVPIDNCYPHPNCDAINNKNKDKKDKDKPTQRTEDEDDD